MLQSVTVQAPGCLFPSCKNIAARQDVKGLDIVNAGKGRTVRIEGPGLRASAMPGVSRRKGRQKKAMPLKNRKSKKPKALLPEMQPETIPRHNCERRREKKQGFPNVNRFVARQVRVVKNGQKNNFVNRTGEHARSREALQPDLSSPQPADEEKKKKTWGIIVN
jgi:hypothetical protein